MAQGQVAHQQLAGPDAPDALTDRERFELQQYNKIVQFRDLILSGKHPSIKVPTSAQAASQPKAPGDAVAKPLESSSSRHSSTNAVPPSLPRILSRPGKVEFNPIFLEKSDDLIRAELQLQRQRIERALKEEVDQRRALKHTQTEPLSEFDLSDVLAKALTLVQATAAPPPHVDDNLTANYEAASDSFDDNTFYSSQHDTPESHLTSRIRNESEDNQTANILQRSVPSAPTVPTADKQIDISHQGNAGIAAFPGLPAQQDAASVSQAPGPRAVQVPGLNNYPDRGVSSTGPSHPASGEQSEDSGPMDVEYQRTDIGPRASQQLRDAYAAIHPPSPLARGHDPLASGVRPLQVAEAAGTHPRGTPAQVAALRNEPTAATSPESSPQGPNGRQAKKKKKKRKADRQAPDTEPTPYIKPEPRSPSPVVGPSFVRPNKRQRHNREPAVGPSQIEPRYEAAPIPASQHDIYEPSLRTDERIPRGYGHASVQPQRAVSTTVLGETRMGQGHVDDRQGPNDPYLRSYASPRALPYTPNGGHSARPVAQQVIVDDPYRDSQRLGREPYEYSRMSVRPDNGQFVAAPRPPPTRIYVDAFGREYIEPPPPSVRQSVAPSAAPADPELLYERVRAPSRYPEPGTYENGGLYPQPPPTYSVPRRVVTQPEYISQDYRDPRHREYSSARALGPPGDYVQVMAPPGRRIIEDRPRDYASRAASVRPAETVRYELPSDYGRIQSVRPEGPIREYATGAQPEPRRELVQPYLRDLSSRPLEQHVVRREYSTRPMEQYYDPHVPGSEVAFIDRPRGATQEIVYADDARRELYR